MRKLLLLLGPVLAITACGGASVTDLFGSSTSGGGGASSSSSMHATASATATATTGMTSASSGMQTSSSAMMTSSTGMESSSSSSDVASSAVASSAASTGSGMGCVTCNDIVAQKADPMNVCPGASADAYNKLTQCVCSVGGACYFSCVGNVCIGFMASFGCNNCVQDSQQGCGAQLATCVQN
jgi:hypothetical protein